MTSRNMRQKYAEIGIFLLMWHSTFLGGWVAQPLFTTFTAKKIGNIHLTTNIDYPQIRKITTKEYLMLWKCQNMRYVHFAKIITQKCSKLPSTRQLHMCFFSDMPNWAEIEKINLINSCWNVAPVRIIVHRYDRIQTLTQHMPFLWCMCF